MKIALISDTHFGIKKSSRPFLKSQIRFFKEEFIPYLNQNFIDTICILGDLFDNRNNINVYMKNEVFNLFKNHLYPFKIYIFPGNHDIYYKTSIEVNSLKFLGKFENVNLIEEIEVKNFDNKKVLFVPWQIDYNDFRKRVAEKNTHCDVCLGHFDIIGFPFNSSIICQKGLQSDLFLKNYTLTFSGHFHKRHIHKQKDREVIMIGSPYELTRNDKGDKRGFCILDLDNLKYDFVNSKKTIKFIDVKYPKKVTKRRIKGNVVDIQVDYDIGKSSDDAIQEYIQKIESFEPVYPPNVHLNHNLFEKEEMSYEVKSITELINDYIQNLDIDNKEEVHSMINELYKNSKSSEI